MICFFEIEISIFKRFLSEESNCSPISINVRVLFLSSFVMMIVDFICVVISALVVVEVNFVVLIFI